MDPLVFYRGFSADSPVTTGARHLSAAATRLCFAVVYAITDLPEAIWVEFKRLLSPQTLWGLCIVAAGWLIATVIGGPIGAAINGLLLAYGLYELWPVVKEVAGDLWLWLKTAYYAENEADLKTAGHYFAEALAKGGLTTLEAIVTHRVFRATASKLRERWPTPNWLENRYAEAERKRRTSGESEQQRRSAAELEQQRRRLAELNEKLASGASRVIVPAGKGVGEFPTGLAVAGGLAVALGVGATALWASSQKEKK